jgi:hypothetical protein
MTDRLSGEILEKKLPRTPARGLGASGVGFASRSFTGLSGLMPTKLSSGSDSLSLSGRPYAGS